FSKIRKAFSSPIPVKESILERFAFLKEPLNTKGIFKSSVILTKCSAILNAISSLSMAQGPAKIKKLPLSKYFILGSCCKFIFFVLYLVFYWHLFFQFQIFWS